MTKKEILDYIFKSKDGASWNEVSEMLNEFKQQAIADHEASQWKKYPENKPDKEGWYLLDDGTDVGMLYFDDRGFTFMGKSVRNPIAFRELPEPYQEERQSFGSLNGCHNCKHQDNDDVCKKCDDTWDKWEGGEK